MKLDTINNKIAELNTHHENITSDIEKKKLKIKELDKKSGEAKKTVAENLAHAAKNKVDDYSTENSIRRLEQKYKQKKDKLANKKADLENEVDQLQKHLSKIDNVEKELKKLQPIFRDLEQKSKSWIGEADKLLH